jgi:hypothetical protein
MYMLENHTTRKLTNAQAHIAHWPSCCPRKLMSRPYTVSGWSKAAGMVGLQGSDCSPLGLPQTCIRSHGPHYSLMCLPLWSQKVMVPFDVARDHQLIRVLHCGGPYVTRSRVRKYFATLYSAVLPMPKIGYVPALIVDCLASK